MKHKLMGQYTSSQIVATPPPYTWSGYVDDSNDQTNKFTENAQPEDSDILEQASHDAQTWHDVLAASGGALELPKCSYQLLSWTFAANGTPYLKLDVPHIKVTVTNPESRDHQDIPAISAHAAHKTLGHYKDPAGNQSPTTSRTQNQVRQSGGFRRHESAESNGGMDLLLRNLPHQHGIPPSKLLFFIQRARQHTTPRPV
jgi:hypothetical protein